MGKVRQNLVSRPTCLRQLLRPPSLAMDDRGFARTAPIPAEWGSSDARAAGAIVTLAAELAPSFSQRLSAAAAETDRLLDRLLASAPCQNEILRPQRLLDAVRYASLGGGKRIRPFLVVEAAALFEAPRHPPLMPGPAPQSLHRYSPSPPPLP